MRLPSLYIAEEILPFLRAEISKRLYDRGMTQGQIARHLGITQAMVSKYLAGRYKRAPEEVLPELEKIAEDASNLILIGATEEELIVFVSRRLLELFRRGSLCRLYAEYAGVSPEVCGRIFSPEPSRKEILDLLSLALKDLLSDEKFSTLIPEVRSNFAFALERPRSPEDVAAVPGRITTVKGHPYALPPEFGASRFTAGILVELGKIRPEIRSVLNIRYGKDVEMALEKAGISYTRVKTGGFSEEDAVKVIASPFERGEYDAVIDGGGEGVEPLVYIFGRDPLEVLRKLKELERFL